MITMMHDECFMGSIVRLIDASISMTTYSESDLTTLKLVT